MSKWIPRRGSLALRFSVAIFIILLLTFMVFCGFILILAQCGKLGYIDSAQKALPIVLVTGVSLPVSMVLSVFILQITLKPVNKLVQGMKRLSEGHFEDRIDLGRGTPLRELSNSFNTLAGELQNTEMLRSDFVNNFSHEFKTPIVSIKGFAQLLRRGNLPETEQREYLDVIVDESTRLASMATNVLNLTKIENQSILTDVSRFNLSEQIRRCVLILEKKWTAKELEIDAEFDEYLIEANQELTNQIWLNILDNSIKFSPERGKISLTISPAPDGVCVSIANHGPRLTEQEQRRLYDKFWQGDTSHASEGTGIGMSVVKKIVELHKGDISISSTERETVFTVFLPGRVEQL